MFSAITKTLKNRPTRSDIQADVLAGLTVGVIALPLSMALAIASGVAPQHGLYTAIIAGIVVAITGGSKVNISGPTAAFVVVLLPIVQQFGLGGLLISGFMAGMILVAMGVARLGKLIEVVPYPVVVGFTAGIGVVIATFQLKDFFGLDIDALDGHYLDNLALIIQKIPTVNPQELSIGALTLTVLILWPKLRSKIPGHLVALLLASLVVWLTGQLMPEFSVATIGSRFHFEINGIVGSGIPPIVPSFNWPWHLPAANGEAIGLSWELIRALMPAAITIAVLGSLESLLCAVVADGMSGKKHNPNDELIGQGIGNMLVPLFGGIPATAAIARTAANVKAGGRSPLASVVHGLFILLAILSLAPLLSYIPMAAMAALLLMVAWNMSEPRHFIRTMKVAPTSDVVVLLLCFSLTVLFDMTIAVAVGMGLAAVLFIQKSIALTTTSKIEKSHEKYGELPHEVVIFDIYGSLFFGSAQKAMNNITLVSPEVRVVILDMYDVNMIDMSAIMTLESIGNDLHKKGIGLVIANLHPRMMLKLRRAGIRKKIGKLAFAKSIESALEKAKNMLQ
ncbi:MAG: C4-dicarboxylic acid transporter DauA [Gammaproteobacteria bacterium]|jgi:SulP family sulfate permease|nr:C4-dicarboxylic acid transporter DauA [Gammaproteobacteria bacterium]